jgi:hypothetical protein
LTPTKPRTEVTVWASELEAGTLPRVCVRSGKPANANLTLTFSPAKIGLSVWVLGVGTMGPSYTGPLPLTRRWRRVMIGFRVVASAAGAAGVLALFSEGAFPESSRATVVGVSLGVIVLAVVAGVVYAGLRPKGYVLANAQGERYVLLTDAHPAFVAAVDAMEAPLGTEYRVRDAQLAGDQQSGGVEAKHQ